MRNLRSNFEAETISRSKDIGIFRNLKTRMLNTDQVGSWLEILQIFIFYQDVSLAKTSVPYGW